MTIGELRDKLATLDSNANVAVLHESDEGQDLFEIQEVSTGRGTAKRVDGKAGFEWKRDGTTEWAFISITPA